MPSTWYSKTQTDSLLGGKAALAVFGGGRDLFEGVDVQSDGHSYGIAGITGTNAPRTTWFQRVQARLRAATYTNLNVSGAQSPDAAGKAAASAPTAFRGLVLWDCTINDANRNSTAGTLAGFQAGLLTWLLIRRASAKFEAETFATETGTWTAVTDSYASGGTARQTTVQNAKQTYTVSGATKWFILLAGGVGATAMGTAVIAVDGATVATVPLTGIYAATQNNGSRTWFPYAAQVTVPDTASHTITVTKSDAAASPVIVDALYAREVAPPLIVLNKAIYPVSGATSATVDTYNAAIDTVAAQVATDGTIITVDSQAAGFAAATMTNDGLHPNNLGAGFVASVIQRTLDALAKTASIAVRLGVDYNGTVANSAAAGAPTITIADNFNRADSSSSLGSTSTGAKPWTATAGTWGISSNAAYSATAGNGDVAIIDSGISDQHVVATISGGTAGGLLVRGNAAGTTYYSVASGAVYRIVAGVVTQIGTLSSNLVAGDVVELDAVGTTITVKRNGTTVCSVTDSGITTGTYVGFRLNGPTVAQRWDDFSVV